LSISALKNAPPFAFANDSHGYCINAGLWIAVTRSCIQNRSFRGNRWHALPAGMSRSADRLIPLLRRRSLPKRQRRSKCVFLPEK